MYLFPVNSEARPGISILSLTSKKEKERQKQLQGLQKHLLKNCS